MQIGMGFWASKTVLAAVTFNLFSLLAQRPQSATEIKKKLGIHQRSLYDFIDALVALGFLHRTGPNGDSIYANTPDVDFFLS